MQNYKKLYDTYASFKENEAEPAEIQEAQEELDKALHAVHNSDAAQSIDAAIGHLLHLHEVEGFETGCCFMREIRSVLEGK